MKVLDDRRARGVQDAAGLAPGPMPPPQAMLEAGTANQTRLIGAPASSPLYDFAPAIDQYLKSHLFGDIFARDNLDWRSRELATVAALAALSGVESQLQSHIKIAMNVGITREQLRQFAADLSSRAVPGASERVVSALDKATS
jgi:4-carboxymuconolactone decarboxylase